MSRLQIKKHQKNLEKYIKRSSNFINSNSNKNCFNNFSIIHIFTEFYICHILSKRFKKSAIFKKLI